MAFVLYNLSKLLAALPRSMALRLGRSCGWMVGSLLRYRRSVALEALRQSFPKKNEAELVTVVNRMYAHLGTTAVEVARLTVKGRSDMEGRVRLHGTNHVEAMARSAGGGLMLMGHIGNWELCAWLAACFPRPVHAVVKPIRSAALERYVEKTRKKMGLGLLPFRGSYRDTLRALKRGEFVTVILDQNTKRSVGVSVEFFSRTAYTTPGLAILSAQSGLPVFPVYDIRAADGTHDVHVLPPVPPPADRREEALRAKTQEYTSILEDIIRRHPDQWTWIHKRWRTQPKADEASD